MYDAIVVGAGPAGNVAAHRMAEKGYSVAVLDWREKLGDKLCTGIIGSDCLQRFPPSQQDIHREASSATVFAPSGKTHKIAREKPQAYILDRVAFVERLAKRAQEAGASFSLGERVDQVHIRKSGVVVTAGSGNGVRRFEAKILVVASGFSSPLLQMVGLDDGGRMEHMVGCQSEVIADHIEDTEVYLGDPIAPGSFGWVVPLSGENALVGLVSRSRLNGHMGTFLSALQQRGKVKSMIKQPKRWGIPVKPLPRTYSDRVLVVGDAAGFVKPTTGGGIYYSLLSGEMAAETAHKSFLSDDFSRRTLRHYETHWKSVFGRELRVGYYARRLYEALGDDQREYLLDAFVTSKALDDLVSAGDFAFDWHSGPILKAIGHKELGKVIRSFGPAVAPFLSRLNGSKPG